MNNYISVNNVILRLKDSFGVSIENDRYKIIDSIGYGISSLRFGVGYKNNYKELEIDSFKSKSIGSDVLFIYDVINNGEILIDKKKQPSLWDDPMKIEQTQNDLIGIIKATDCTHTSQEHLECDECRESSLEPYQTIMNVNKASKDFLYAVKHGKVKKSNSFWWYQEGNVIKTNIEKGDILLYYKTFLTDSEGYPMIYNSFNYIEYLIWFVMHRLLMSGYKHPVLTIKESFQEVERYGWKIQNEIMADTFDEISFAKNWNKFVKGLSL